MKRYSFKKQERISLSRDFEKVYKIGKRYENDLLAIIIYNREQGELEPTLKRLGLVVSKKLAKVYKRNKLKRRLREIFRLNKAKLKNGIDMLFIPKQGAIDASYKLLEEKIFELFKMAGILK